MKRRFEVLHNRAYRRLFSAQVVALFGTGVATVALALLAFDLAGPNAGAVLGTALAIKMLAYVGLSPIANAAIEVLPRKATLVALDLVRAGVVALLPFVDQVWHVYVLVFALQAASAAFTPTFQAAIPDIVPDKARYTEALSLSRLAYDLENLLSPMLAAAALNVLTFHALFGFTVLGFVASAALVACTPLPAPVAGHRHSPWSRTTRGIRLYLSTPRLRGLLALCMVASAAGAAVLVNTVSLVQGELGLTARSTALAFAAFGAGSMVAALALPSLLERTSERAVMVTSGVGSVVGLVLSSQVHSFGWALPVWFWLGLASGAIQTPAGRLLVRSALPSDRRALFTAQFSLSHAGWLIAYPLAGFCGTSLGLPASFAVLALVAAIALSLGLLLWPSRDTADIVHDHADLPADHPHLKGGSRVHRHAVTADGLHW